MKKQLLLTLILSFMSLSLIGMDANNPTILTGAATSATPVAAAAAASTTLTSTAPTTFVNPVVFTTADEQEITVEKEIAELCQTIKDLLNDFGSQDQKIPVLSNKADLEKLVNILNIFANSALSATQKTQSIKETLNSYSIEDLIILLSTADFLNVQENIFQIILECATARIFDINNLNYVSNQNIFELLKNPAIEQMLVHQCFKQIPGLTYWIYRLPWQSKTLTGHTNSSVSSIAWSPDGTKLATASYDNTAKIWDANSGNCLQTLNGHTNSVPSIAWSPDGTQLATASWDNTARIWDANSGNCLQTLKGHTRYVNSVAWSPDGTKLATASFDNTAKIWDANSGNCLQTLNGHTNDVNFVAWSPDGTKLATASYDNTAKIWDANSGNCLQTLNGHTNDVNFVAWSPDGTKLATASYDNTAKIWDANSGNCLQTLKGHTRYVNSVAWSPDGTKLATASFDNTAKIWDANTGTCLHTLTGHRDWVYSVSWSPDGTKLATASNDGTARIWDANTSILNKISIEQVLFLIHVYHCIENNQKVDFVHLALNKPKLLTDISQLPKELKELMPENVQYMAREPKPRTQNKNNDSDDLLDGACSMM